MSIVIWLFRLAAAGSLLLGQAVAPPQQETLPTPAAASTPAEAATIPFAPPVWISPTPDATGAIVVIVQPGESLWVIAARAGLSLPNLLALNNLTDSAIINPGDALIVGYVTPAAPSPEPTQQATLPPPTPRPTATPAVAVICVSAFDDRNRDGEHDPNEPLRAGVAFTVYNTQAVVANYVTDGRSEPKCLTGLAPGEYRITRSTQPGEVLTTAGDWALSLVAGGELRQAFGSFIDETQAAASPAGSLSGGQPAATTPVITPAVETTAVSGLPSEAQPPAPQAPAATTLRSLAPRLAAVVMLFLGGLILLGAVLILLFRQSRSRPVDARIDADTDGERRFRNIDDLE